MPFSGHAPYTEGMNNQELHALLDKIADQTETDENRIVPGKLQVHTDPAGRQPGTIHAKWGDKPALDADGYPIAHGSGATDEAEEDRRGVLERILENVGDASTADKALISQNFHTTDTHTPHSILLQKEGMEKRHDPTLSESVQSLLR